MEIVAIFFLVIVLLIMLFIVFNKDDNSSIDSTEDEIEMRTERTELNVEYSDEELFEDVSSYDTKIVLSDAGTTAQGNGAKVNNNKITITSAGTYYLTGTLSDGNILIESSKNDVVRLVLDNVSLTSSTTAPINCVTANKLIITLAKDSTNTITDSSLYSAFTDTENQEPDSAIFTKTDLVINGTGNLVVNANYSDGISSKDGLKIINSNIEINSADDGIRGKDYVVIKNANIIINSKGDGIKSTNDSDENLGYIVIEGGSITIYAESDGIQAETILNISSDTNIVTTGEVASSNKGQYFGFDRVQDVQTTETSTEDSTSSKGLKAGKEITIKSGNIVISSTDDAIHSNDVIIIDGGSIELSSGDDGIHANTDIVINGGNINILDSYEGIESAYIEINGGEINVVASDDGINISSGNGSSIEGMPGQNPFGNPSNSNRKLVINGGNIKVNSTGDGLDSNGSIYINGGKVLVVGTTSGGNGALDYDSECVVTGGELIVYGSTGMWQNPTNNSTQYSITYYSSGDSGEEIQIKDSSENIVSSFTTERAYGAIIISNSNIKQGETYTMYRNGSEVGSITVDSIVSTYGTSGNMNDGDMMRPEAMQRGNQEIQN